MEHQDIDSSDMNHFTTMISGCESINTYLKTGNGLNDDGRYAFTVLKLHAGDAGFIDGQEGFMDQVKAKAKDIKSFVDQVIKAIVDALYIYVGGRSNFEKMVKKFKNSSAAEVFKSAAKKAADNELVPALERVKEIAVSIIDVEYQEFHRREIADNNAVNAFFIENDKVEKNIDAAIRKLKDNPTEADLSFDPLITHIEAVVKSGKKILETAKNAEEPNQKMIRNIVKCISKYHRVISGLNAATGRAQKYFGGK